MATATAFVYIAGFLILFLELLARSVAYPDLLCRAPRVDRPPPPAPAARSARSDPRPQRPARPRRDAGARDDRPRRADRLRDHGGAERPASAADGPVRGRRAAAPAGRRRAGGRHLQRGADRAVPGAPPRV